MPKAYHDTGNKNILSFKQLNFKEALPHYRFDSNEESYL